jgi:hypothetical protein
MYVHNIFLHQLHFSDNGSRVDSIRQNIQFDIQQPSKFIFLAFHKKSLKVIRPLKIYQYTFHGSTLTGAPTSEV